MSKGGDWWHLDIWLPRQDQLQAMVPQFVSGQWSLSILLEKVLDFLNESDIPLPHVFTMEQLCLAFVMKEKYGKVWNGGDWVQ